MKRVYITKQQLEEALGVPYEQFNTNRNGSKTNIFDTEITVNGSISGDTKVTTDKIMGSKTPRNYFGARGTHSTIKCSIEKNNLISESNKDLENKIYTIPDNIYTLLKNNLNIYKNKKNVNGIKRLTNLVSNRNIKNSEMYRLKSYFQNIDEKSEEFNVLGGKKMKQWIDLQLKNATNASKFSKDVKHMMGDKNAYIKKHNKENKNGKAHSVKKNNITFNYE